MIYDNINHLILENPTVTTKPCKIKLLSWGCGFGSALMVLLANIICLKEINNNIVIEPLWNTNTSHFKYHDPTLKNSFTKYFVNLNKQTKQTNIPTYVTKCGLVVWNKGFYKYHNISPKLEEFEKINLKKYYANLKYEVFPFSKWGKSERTINCFKNNFELQPIIIKQAKNGLKTLIKHNYPIYGIHLRSNKQKHIHFKQNFVNIKQTCEEINNKHKDEKCYFFIATDVDEYLKIAQTIFKDKIIFFKNFLRTDIGTKDSIPTITQKPGLRYGYEILVDAYVLSVCDKFYYSPSNVHFLTRCLGTPNDILYGTNWV